MNQAYSRTFYASRHEKTAYSAAAILGVVLDYLPTPIESAVDLGCGVGTWLSVLQQQGVATVQGVDGKWVDLDLLEIARDSFLQADISKVDVELPRRFDLAMTLEVAEHLPPERAAGFVQSLTKLSDYVLFSAAIPLQGGVNHLNEQWQQYWADLFAQHDYVLHDIVRGKVWEDAKIPFWYRQNALLFCKSGTPVPEAPQSGPVNLVHPELFLEKVSTGKTLKRRLKNILKAVKKFRPG